MGELALVPVLTVSLCVEELARKITYTDTNIISSITAKPPLKENKSLSLSLSLSLISDTHEWINEILSLSN